MFAPSPLLKCSRLFPPFIPSELLPTSSIPSLFAFAICSPALALFFHCTVAENEAQYRQLQCAEHLFCSCLFVCFVVFSSSLADLADLARFSHVTSYPLVHRHASSFCFPQLLQRIITHFPEPQAQTRAQWRSRWTTTPSCRCPDRPRARKSRKRESQCDALPALSTEEIDDAKRRLAHRYRKLAMKWHPDKNAHNTVSCSLLALGPARARFATMLTAMCNGATARRKRRRCSS